MWVITFRKANNSNNYIKIVLIAAVLHFFGQDNLIFQQWRENYI